MKVQIKDTHTLCCLCQPTNLAKGQKLTIEVQTGPMAGKEYKVTVKDCNQYMAWFQEKGVEFGGKKSAPVDAEVTIQE